LLFVNERDSPTRVVHSFGGDVPGQVLPTIMYSAGADGNWLTEDVTGTYFSPIGNPYLFTGRRWDASCNVTRRGTSTP